MAFAVGLNSLHDVNKSRPPTPRISPAKMKMPIKVGLAFLLMLKTQRLVSDSAGFVDFDWPRVRNSRTYGSVELFNISRGLPCARIVRVFVSRKTELSAMAK